MTWEDVAQSDSRAAAILKRYHARPHEELYDLHADPTEQQNLADKPELKPELDRLRAELDAWMLSQGDQQTLLVEPRLLSDEYSYGRKGALPKADAQTPKKAKAKAKAAK